MSKWQIILSPVVFLAGCQPWWGQQLAPAAPPGSPYPATTAPAPVFGPPYIQPQPMIQPGTPVVPVYPPQSTVVPLPSQTPGSIFGPPMAPTGPIPTNGVPPGAVVAPQAGVPVGPEAIAAP